MRSRNTISSTSQQERGTIRSRENDSPDESCEKRIRLDNQQGISTGSTVSIMLSSILPTFFAHATEQQNDYGDLEKQLHQAVVGNDSGTVQQCLNNPELHINAVDSQNITALEKAASLGRTDIVIAILNNDNAYVKRSGAKSALYYAALNNHTEIMTILANAQQARKLEPALDSRGAICELNATLTYSAMCEAAQDKSRATLLMSRICEAIPAIDVNESSISKRTFLSCAASNGDIEAIRFLLGRGAFLTEEAVHSIFMGDSDKTKKFQIFETLFELNAELVIAKLQEMEELPLHWVVYDNDSYNINIIELFLKYMPYEYFKRVPNNKDFDCGKTFLHTVLQGFQEGEPEALSGNECIALINLVKQYCPELLNEPTEAGNPLHGLLVLYPNERPTADNIIVIKALLDSGVDINMRDQEGLTPLTRDSEYSCIPVEVLELAKERGADFSAVSAEGNSYLQCAISGHLLFITDCNGNDRYDMFIDSEDFPCTKYLTKLFVWAKENDLAFPLQSNHNGETALHTLVKHVANLIADENENSTYDNKEKMADAISYGVELIQNLIDMGFESNAQRSDGKTIIDLAENVPELQAEIESLSVSNNCTIPAR